MRTLTLISMLLIALFLAACQSTSDTSSDSSSAECKPVFTDIMTHRIVSENDLVTLEEVENVPFEGSLSGQAINLYDEFMTLSEYDSTEAVSEMMQTAQSKKTIGDSSVVLDDAPATYGDDSFWVELNDALGSTAGVAQYADFVIMAKPAYEGNIENMLNTFDENLQTYIKDHPECAYVHPETR